MLWRSWFLISGICAVLLSYRMYVVLHREIPSEIENPHIVRWLDEAGRVGNTLTWICHQLGVEHATWPAKMVVNFGARLLFNGFGKPVTNITVRYTSIDSVPVTIFLPDTLTTKTKYPTMVYFHGGGWTWFSVDVYAGYLAHLAKKTNVQIVAVDYRKAPQFPFPAAYDDCLTVTNGLLKRTADFKIKAGKLVVAGDGSGGNLAAAVAHATKGKILMQILINPALQIFDFETPSYQDNVNTLPGLSSAFRNSYHWLSYAGISKDFLQMAVQNNHISQNNLNSAFSSYLDSKKYLPSYHGVTKRQTKRNRKSANIIVTSAFNGIIADPRIAPMMAVHIKDVPNVYMITSQYDVYRDEAIMYTHRLFDAGVKVKLEHYHEAFHGFFMFCGYGPIEFEVSKQALNTLADFLNNMAQ
ncbi:neutral cholesterol ester hydrolase 1-like [Ruditapes philippinarum]|uniref:neutral cholesterol ester hydrolase 1-like n=1 Tax=Ruditapes philippinarum TaxID=129788 RepID=UPI00295C14E2|nr:neutral cholesterol ester hydrolase 1-like [Ruditapes philippinarum]